MLHRISYFDLNLTCGHVGFILNRLSKTRERKLIRIESFVFSKGLKSLPQTFNPESNRSRRVSVILGQFDGELIIYMVIVGDVPELIYDGIRKRNRDLRRNYNPIRKKKRIKKLTFAPKQQARSLFFAANQNSAGKGFWLEQESLIYSISQDLEEAGFSAPDDWEEISP